MKIRYTRALVLMVGCFAFLSRLWAQDAAKTATITRYYGKVKILTAPSKQLKGPPPHVLYDGLYYRILKVKRGMTLKNGNIIQTGPKAKARLVYDNGDQITVSESSSYKVTWDTTKRDQRTFIDVLFGKFRAMIRKKGPRRDLNIKTHTLSMGVRGTDFHIIAHNREGGSTVSVLRGNVLLRPRTGAPEKEPVEVKSGFSASVPKVVLEKPKAPLPKKIPESQKRLEPKPPRIVVVRTTKQDLVEIQKASVVPRKPEIEKLEPLPPVLTKKIASLEAKAVTSTLIDIKEEDPPLYRQIIEEKKEIKDVDKLGTITVKKAFKAAPSAKKPRQKLKPTEEDLEDVKDIYEKYFNY